MEANHGTEEGEKCNREGCEGVLEILKPLEGCCACHINPPCGYCMDTKPRCPECKWEEGDRIEKLNEHVAIASPSGVWKTWRLRELDATKIDWHSSGHTNSSMRKKGVYPPGTTQEEVLAKVKGTFGGQFNYFKDGQFEYIAYTD
jgi:hypothetical protein